MLLARQRNTQTHRSAHRPSTTHPYQRMTPIFAELSSFEVGGIIGSLVFSGATSIIMLIALVRHKTTEISPQPLAIQLVQELHEQFAGKDEFKELVQHNTERHAQLFKSIERVEREARQDTDRRFTELNAERRQTLDKLNAQFQVIGESLASINTELKLKREEAR